MRILAGLYETRAADALAAANDELHTALADVETQLAQGSGPREVRLTKDRDLIVPPLTAEDVPAEGEALRAQFGSLLPRVPIASRVWAADRDGVRCDVSGVVGDPLCEGVERGGHRVAACGFACPMIKWQRAGRCGVAGPGRCGWGGNTLNLMLLPAPA